MAQNETKVEGRNVGRVVLYALSTCAWCKRTKRFLNELGIEYSYIDVDTLSAEDSAAAKDEVRKFNSNCTFPTLIVNDEQSVAGHNERKTRKVLGL